MINYNKLLNNLETLKLDKMAIFLPNYLESIKNQDISIIDILYRLIAFKKYLTNIKTG